MKHLKSLGLILLGFVIVILFMIAIDGFVEKDYQQRKVEMAFAISYNCQLYAIGQLPFPILEDLGVKCYF
jgi:hypothetical protein